MDEMDKAIEEIKAFNEEERENGKIREEFTDINTLNIDTIEYEIWKHIEMIINVEKTQGSKTRQMVLDKLLKHHLELEQLKYAMIKERNKG